MTEVLAGIKLSFSTVMALFVYVCCFQMNLATSCKIGLAEKVLQGENNTVFFHAQNIEPIRCLAVSILTNCNTCFTFFTGSQSRQPAKTA